MLTFMLTFYVDIYVDVVCDVYPIQLTFISDVSFQRRLSSPYGRYVISFVLLSFSFLVISTIASSSSVGRGNSPAIKAGGRMALQRIAVRRQGHSKVRASTNCALLWVRVF